MQVGDELISYIQSLFKQMQVICIDLKNQKCGQDEQKLILANLLQIMPRYFFPTSVPLVYVLLSHSLREIPTLERIVSSQS